MENLTVQDNRGLTAVDGLSLSVRAGEILGIAAIEGNGQSELLEAIAGMRPVEHGKIFVHEQDVTGKTPGEIRAAGLAHVPEDRLATGLSAEASVTENLLAGKQREPRFSGFAFCQRTSSIERYASELYEKFDIRGAGTGAKAGSMSGGNMQKVVIAREFSFDAPVLLIAQPTRGVDVGAIEFIHARILEKCNEGLCHPAVLGRSGRGVPPVRPRHLMYEGQDHGRILRRGDLPRGDRLLHDRRTPGGGAGMKKRIDPGYLISLLLSVVLAFAIGAVIPRHCGLLARQGLPCHAERRVLQCPPHRRSAGIRHGALPVRSGLRARRARRHLQRRRRGASSCSAPSSPVRSACGSTA